MGVTLVYSITLGNLKGDGRKGNQPRPKGTSSREARSLRTTGGLPPPVGASAFCANCGRPLVPGATFCSVCGARAGSVVPGTPPAGTPLFGYGPGYGPAGPMIPVPRHPPPNAASAPTDSSALRAVRWAALAAIVAAVSSFVYTALEGLGTGFESTTQTASTTTVQFHIPVFLYYLLFVGIVLELVELFLVRSAFASLRTLDSRFASPATFALLAIIAIPIVLVGAILLFNGLAQTTCTSTSPGISNCSFGAGLWGGIAIIVIGGIIALVGVIGVLIGLWRLGDRYDESMFHAGTILSIIPFLSVIGWILIFAASSSALRRTSAGNPTVPSF
jgi:hypothetical protein